MHPGNAPGVLAWACDLCKDKDPQNGISPMLNHVSTCEEDKECSNMVDDEEEVLREEYQVVEKVYEEICCAEFENRIFEGRVWCGEAMRMVARLREDCPSRQEESRCAMGEGGEAAGGVRAAEGLPVTEEVEVSKEIY